MGMERLQRKLLPGSKCSSSPFSLVIADVSFRFPLNMLLCLQEALSPSPSPAPMVTTETRTLSQALYCQARAHRMEMGRLLSRRRLRGAATCTRLPCRIPYGLTLSTCLYFEQENFSSSLVSLEIEYHFSRL